MTLDDDEYTSFIYSERSQEALALERTLSPQMASSHRCVLSNRVQQERSWWCGLASVQTALRYLAQGSLDVPVLSQEDIYRLFVKNIMSTSNGLCFLSLSLILSAALSYCNLPFRLTCIQANQRGVSVRDSLFTDVKGWIALASSAPTSDLSLNSTNSALYTPSSASTPCSSCTFPPSSCSSLSASSFASSTTTATSGSGGNSCSSGGDSHSSGDSSGRSGSGSGSRRSSCSGSSSSSSSHSSDSSGSAPYTTSASSISASSSFPSSPIPFLLLVNFARTVGSRKSGHWCPLSGATAISSQAEEVVVVAVAEVSPKLEPHWIGVMELAELINTNSRGYIKLSPLPLSDPHPRFSSRSIPPSIPSALFVRHASPEDALTLAHLQVQAWNAAYCGILPAEFLQSDYMSVKSKLGSWEDILSDAAKVTFVLCERPARIMGYTTLVRVDSSTDHSRRKITSEILKRLSLVDGVRSFAEVRAEMVTLYVTPTSKRQGFGSLLFKFGYYALNSEAADWRPTRKCPFLTADDCKERSGSRQRDNITMSIWVLGGNAAALAFYQKMGSRIADTNSLATFGGVKYPYFGLVYTE